MTDDQGYGDFGVTGNPVIRTPHLDAMARHSGQMTNFYVSPVCSPTRACLMTGRYNYRTRCIDTYLGRSRMDPQEVTIAEVLRQAGYATGIFGKWHLGDNYPMRAMDQGFEQSLVLRGGGIGQPSDPPGSEGKYTDAILFENGNAIQTKGYCTDVYFDNALAWIKQCRQQQRNFFAYIPTNAPHAPFHDVPEAPLEYYQGRNLNNDQFPQTKGHPLPPRCDTDNRARIFAMITNIDDNVGRLFRQLDALGITENTLVLFLVDNGPNGRRYVTGMRGMKSEVYEGGIRSPLFAHWPGTLPAGRRSDRVAAHIDLFRTILDACGVLVPEGLSLDGRSILPLLKGEPTAWPDRTIFIQSHRGDRPVRYHNFAARSQQWKLLHASGFGKESFTGDPKFELYNMETDPLETRDLSRQRPDIVERMRRQYDAWFDDVSRTRPDNYAPPRIHIGTPRENPVVLTRQDWHHVKGRPWAADSNGYWQLHAARSGPYDIRMRFPAVSQAAEATLEIGDRNIVRSVSQNATECLFADIQIHPGDVRLMATLSAGNTSRGPWQVDVIGK
ncbi:MAG: arylsulfatase [Sedimentisphaerales bacterium]|nr:arylsulfatase [Sedimentisphaerales bacterium]